MTEHTCFSTDTIYGPRGLAALQGERAVIVFYRDQLPSGQLAVDVTNLGSPSVSWSFELTRDRLPETGTGVFSDSHAVGFVDPESGKWNLYDDAGRLVTSFYYGNPGDYPFMGDWNGDGVETPGLYRQSDGYV